MQPYWQLPLLCYLASTHPRNRHLRRRHPHHRPHQLPQTATMPLFAVKTDMQMALVSRVRVPKFHSLLAEPRYP